MDAAQRPRLAHQKDLVAAHREDLSRHPGGQIAGEEHRHRRDFFGAHGLDALDASLLFRGLGRDGADHSAPGERRDAIGAHVETGHVERDRFRQADDAQLGGGVIGLAEIADQPRGRGEMHVAAALLLAKVLGSGARHVEASHQMHVDHHLPVDMRHAMEDAVAQDAGVVDDAIDAAELLDRGLDHTFGAGRIGDAVGAGDGAPARGADLADHGFGRPGVDALAFGRAAQIVDHDRRPLVGGKPRDIAADAATSARHQHDLAFETPHGSSSPCFSINRPIGAPAIAPKSRPASPRSLLGWPKACARTAEPGRAAARRPVRRSSCDAPCADACSPR